MQNVSELPVSKACSAGEKMIGTEICLKKSKPTVGIMKEGKLGRRRGERSQQRDDSDTDLVNDVLVDLQREQHLSLISSNCYSSSETMLHKNNHGPTN